MSDVGIEDFRSIVVHKGVVKGNDICPVVKEVVGRYAEFSKEGGINSEICLEALLRLKVRIGLELCLCSR